MTAENAKKTRDIRQKARIMQRKESRKGKEGGRERKKPKVNCSIKGKRKAHFHFMLARRSSRRLESKTRQRSLGMWHTLAKSSIKLSIGS